MLENHAKQWMKGWHFCPGFHGEQGGEGFRAIFKPLIHALITSAYRLTSMHIYTNEVLFYRGFIEL